MSTRWSEADYQAYLTRQRRHLDVLPAVVPPPAPVLPVDRYKSKTERRYAELLAHWKHEQVILDWWYEPHKGLYLGHKTSYTPDFLLQYAPAATGRRLEFHEVKGAKIWPQDWIKAKHAAARYPCYRFVLAQWKDGQWQWKDIPAI